MSTVITNIGLLVTHDEARPERADAALVIDEGRVAWVGDARDAPDADERIDADGACVIPGFVDSHNHLVFAGDRATEFEARMTGQAYAAGGIRTTVAATRAATDAQLLANGRRLAAEARRQGTTTLETKSGYGLDVETEARVKQAIDQLRSGRTTFIIAHRLTTVRDADRIVFMDNGRIVEAGRFDELAARNGRFAALLRAGGLLTDEEVRRLARVTAPSEAA